MKFKILLIVIIAFLASCSQNTKREAFLYTQNFQPETARIFSQDARLVFADVREETRLSNWNTANWQLADGFVKVTGSRTAEMQRRENVVKDLYQGNESFVILRGYRAPWLTLSMGDLAWIDYTAETTVSIKQGSSAGLAFRYQNSRQYYAFMLMKDSTARLFLRLQNREATPEHEAWMELGSVNFPVQPDREYHLNVNVRGSRILCSVDDSILIDHNDATLQNGKVALLADNPATFSPVTVEGVLEKQKPRPLPECAKPELVHQIDLPETNGDRNFFFLDVDSDSQLEIIITESAEKNNALRCLEFDGTELWQISGLQNPISEGGDKAFQIFDINGDGQNELVMTADFQIRVYNGKTGVLLKAVDTPKPNPYYDSRDYPYAKLLGDALCPVRLSPNDPPGFYIKDRYTNIWVYDHQLKFLWHKALGTGHFPLPVDINGDNIDEIMACYTLMDSHGKNIWKLLLSDHVDNIAFESLYPGRKPKRFYLAAGEMGLLEVEPKDGQILTRHELGHIQTISIADYLPGKPGLELLTQTLWREDQIFYLFDKDLHLISTWQGSFSIVYPLPWGEKGRDLVLSPDGILDPLTGRVIQKIEGQVLTVLGDVRFGNGLILVYKDDEILIYAPEKGWPVPAKHRPYRDFQSNYLPQVALPK